MKRPQGTRKKYCQRLTAAEKKKIIALTRSGDLKQIEIAAAMKCGVDTIRAVQQAAGLKLWRELTPEVEKECVELLRQGTGQYRTSQMTRVSEPKIRQLMRKHGIVHESGGRALTAEKRAQIAEAIRRREDYCTQLARKFGVSKKTVGKIAHQILGPGRLLGWPVWPPMSSVFPQTNFDFAKMTEPDQFVTFVESVVEKSFDGKFPCPPEHDRLFIAALLVGMQRINPDFDGQPKVVLDNIAMELTVAVDCIRRQRAAAWEN
jgi:hypothetical protein